MDIVETSVTVTPQQEISKTLNSFKFLNVYFWGDKVHYWETTFTFGEIRFTLGDSRRF